MFFCSGNIEVKGLNKFNTSNVKSMAYLFKGSEITSVDLSNFDTSSLTDAEMMFKDCSVREVKLKSQSDYENIKKNDEYFNEYSNISFKY